MKIKEITLENFRHFYGKQEIVFSIDEKKNLTLILAKNNAGKTTLAQSIIWCLYGKTSLNEPKAILNKDIKSKMKPGDTRKVSVTLNIIHKGNTYIIRREQEFKQFTTRFEEMESKQRIMTFDENNVLVELKNKNVNEILPESLSRFFIFDGERMLHLGSNDSVHRSNLKKDIRTILGLDIVEEAINHLGGQNHLTGVMLSLQNQIESYNDIEMEKLKDEIDRLIANINEKEEQINQYKEVLSENESEYARINTFLEENKQISQKQVERQELEDKVSNLKDRKDKIKSQILRKFSTSFSYLLLQKFFDENIKFLSNSSDLGEAAPDVTSRTIDYLLDKKECICGLTFEENDEVYNRLLQRKKLYPPESIGTTIKSHLALIQKQAKENEDIKEELKELIKDYFEVDSEIYTNKTKIESISRSISESSEEKVREAEQRYQVLKKDIDYIKGNIFKLNAEIDSNKGELKNKEGELDKLSNKSEKNRKIKYYKTVTEEVLKHLKQAYKNQEKEVLKQLQNEVQKVYSKINRGKGEIRINEKYFDFEIYTENNGQLIKDNSKGQGLTTVAAFAFVCGITKLVRDQKLSGDLHIENEPYPLIIDAPFSVMDTDYMKKISNILPQYAEQIVILVKDDNYNIVKQVFNDMGIIGKEYLLELERNEDGSENQLKTSIKTFSKVGDLNV